MANRLDKNVYTGTDEKQYVITETAGHYFVRPKGVLDHWIFYDCSDIDECICCIEKKISDIVMAEKRRQEEIARRESRRQELKEMFEHSGYKQNFAETEELETLLDITEKKIIQQCKRFKCYRCKMGWICPKYWSK